MSQPGRDRFYGALADFGLNRRGLLALITTLLVGASVYLGLGLEIRTSRYGMVAKENPYQSRMLGFFDRFGYPDAVLFLVEGGDEASRRAVVDEVTAKLEADDNYRGKVFGRLDAEAIAEVLLLQEPDALGKLREELPDDVDVAATLEGGIPALLGGLEAQLLAGLDSAGAEDVKDEEVDDGFRRIAEIARVLEARLSGGDVDGALDALIESDAAAERRPETMPVDARGYLTGLKSDHLLVAVFPDFENDDVATLSPIVEGMRKIEAEAEAAHEGVKVLVTGTPVMAVDEHSAVGRGLLQSGTATGLGIFLLLCWAFRSIRMTIIGLFPLLVTVSLALGGTILLYGELNMITASFAAVLMGLGIDLSVHLIGRYQEEVREGTERTQAIRAAVMKAGPGILVGSLTTAVAFLLLMTAEFTAYGELGGVTALGLVVAFFSAMTILPALLKTKEAGKANAAPPLPGVGAIMDFVRRMARPLVAFGAVTMVAGGFCLTLVQFNSDYFDFLPEGTESREALEVLEEDGAMSPIFAFTSAPDLESAREMAKKLRTLGTVSLVQAITDMLPPLDEDGRLEKLQTSFEGLRRPDFDKLAERTRTREELQEAIVGVADALDELRFALEQAEKSTKALDEAREAFKSLRTQVEALPEDGGPELASVERELARVMERAWSTAKAVADRGAYAVDDVPAVFRGRHIARDGSGGVSMYVYPKGDAFDRDNIAEFTREVESVDPNAAGVALNLHYHIGMVVNDFRRAALYAGVLVFFLLLLDLRRFSDSVLAISPALVGWCWMLGMFILTGLQFNLANIMALPLVLGIGVDAGAHVMHRQRQSASENGGVAKLDDLFFGTGSAVLLSSVTTMVGFGGLLMAEHGGMALLGAAMVLGVGCTLLSSLVVLPAVLVLLGRAR